MYSFDKWLDEYFLHTYYLGESLYGIYTVNCLTFRCNILIALDCNSISYRELSELAENYLRSRMDNELNK